MSYGYVFLEYGQEKCPIHYTSFPVLRLQEKLYSLIEAVNIGLVHMIAFLPLCENAHGSNCLLQVLQRTEVKQKLFEQNTIMQNACCTGSISMC